MASGMAITIGGTIIIATKVDGLDPSVVEEEVDEEVATGGDASFVLTQSTFSYQL